MRCAVELSDVHDVVFILQHRGLVVVYVKVIGCAENGHDTGESRRPRFSVHAITGVLGFMGSNNRQEVVFLEERACGRIGEEVGATSDVVVQEELGCFFLPKLLEGICPENIAHQAMRWWLPEAINLLKSASLLASSIAFAYILEVVQCVEVRTETTVYAKELLVHDGSQGQGAEGLHTRLVYLLGILVLAFEFEGEVVCQMPAFMVSSQ